MFLFFWINSAVKRVNTSGGDISTAVVGIGKKAYLSPAGEKKIAAYVTDVVVNWGAVNLSSNPDDWVVVDKDHFDSVIKKEIRADNPTMKAKEISIEVLRQYRNKIAAAASRQQQQQLVLS